MRHLLRTRSVIELRERYGTRLKWVVLGAVMVGMMAAILSSTIVYVAVPELSRQFNVGQERVQWVSSAFMISLTLSMLLTPWLLLRYGLRVTYLTATILLMVGGIGCGLSGNFAVLITMRVIEGVASGVLQPIPGIVIMKAFPPDKQGRAMGIFGLGVALVPALGPVFGGVLLEYLGWRWIFFVVVPFCLVSIVMVQRYLGADPTVTQDDKPLDWIGLAWVAFATVAILNGLTDLDDPSSAAWWQLGLGFAALAAFVPYQLRAREPLLQLKVFIHRQVSVGALVAFLYGFGIFGVGYLLPVFLQVALQYSPSQAGLMQLPAGIALAIAIPLSGRLADRRPAHHMVAAGSALLVFSIAIMASVGLQTSFMLAAAWIMLGRIGLGVMSPALSIGAARGLSRAEIPDAMSINGFSRQLGGAMGVSIVGVVLEWRLRANGVNMVELSQGVVQRTLAFDQTFLIVAALSAPAVLAGWFLRPRTPASAVLPDG